jgi:cytochrome c biogenesis protein CcdA
MMKSKHFKTSAVKKLAIGSTLVIVIWIFGLVVGGAGVGYSGQGSTVSVSDIYFCLGRSNIYFVVSLGTEEYLKSLGLWEDVKFKLKTSQPFVITANTHIGSIRDLSLNDKVFLVLDGVEYPHVGKAVALTTHHNTYLVFFPKYDMYGKPIFERESGKFDIVIKDVDFKERLFTFNYPLPFISNKVGSISPDPIRILMLMAAAMAGLALACSPCLLGAMSIGSLAISLTPTTNINLIKRRKSMLIKNTIYFLTSLIVSYIAIAVVVNILQLDISVLRPIEALGGAIVLVFGLAFLRIWRPVAKLENAFASLITKLHPNFRKYVNDDTPQPYLNPKLASTMGSALSLVCSTAGAPTLATSIVLPLLVYAGLNKLEWSFLILFTYLVAVSLPFFLITVGLGELLLTKAYKITNHILIINGFLLVGVGMLLLAGPNFILNTISVLIRITFYGGL